MHIAVTLMRGTGYVGENRVPARDMTTTRDVCFYKLDGPPTARVKFNTCGPKCERRSAAGTGSAMRGPLRRARC